MARMLSDKERGRLDRNIAEAEKRTNTQIVLAVVRRSDNYAELPWKAFALGASAAGLLVFILDLFLFYWTSNVTVLIASGAILASGAVFALMTVLIPAFAWLFLPDIRAEVEVRQYAESLFLNREMFASAGRTGILLLVSLFERKVMLLPDKGLSSRLTNELMNDIIGRMTVLLSHNETARALEDGLELLSGILEKTAKGTGTGRNELSDSIIEEKGV